MAIVDADYKFIYMDIGCNDVVMVVYLDEVTFKPLPDIANPVPYCIIGDDAFPLKKLHPSRHLDITKRVFNYRLSRARRIVENAFDILTHRFGVFQKPISILDFRLENCYFFLWTK
jgi:hypothetical protein